MKVGGKKKNQAGNDALEASTNAVEGENRGDSVGGERDGRTLLYDVVDDGRKENEEDGEKGKEEGEGEGEGEGEEEEEGEEEADEEGDDEEEGQEERPKLDEGYFEIEAIRRKRVRKGKLQYLIKWRGWPETANTWEPLQNLQSCSDVIDAFEESLRSGKHGRKRKRKYGGSHSQAKKKQQRLSSSSNNVTDVNISVIDKPSSSTLLNIFNLPEIPFPTQHKVSHEEENEGNVNIVKTIDQVDEIGGMRGLKKVEKKEENAYDPKLSELKGTVFHNEGNSNTFGMCSQECDGLSNGLTRDSCKEPVQSNHHTGAKRRKSGSVKRFKQDATSSNPVMHRSSTQDITIDSFGTTARLGNEYPGVTENSSSQKTKTEELNIMKILKPISFSASVSDSVQDVLVTFMALRSDGKEVMVDNRFLKAHNPLLLIDFYEQHLKYNPTS